MKLRIKKNNVNILVAVFSVALIIVFYQACEKNDIPKSDLVVKDKLIYKRGSDTPFTGREKARVEDKIIEYDIVNGIKHGEFYLYYEDGTIQIKGKIDSNKNVDKWQYFYPNGEIESEGYFVNDRPEGRWTWFYADGKLKEEGSYHSGQRVGWWKQFDKNGNIIFENEFEMNDSLAAEDSLLSNIKNFPF
jgi:antitoxin component YwqK of YwqJK toxin-antitoxin module